MVVVSSSKFAALAQLLKRDVPIYRIFVIGQSPAARRVRSSARIVPIGLRPLSPLNGDKTASLVVDFSNGLATQPGVSMPDLALEQLKA